MTRDQAVAELRVLVEAASEPVLTTADLDRLISRARRPDYLGLTPDDLGWTPTFDVESAAAEGWRIKAQRVASLPDVTQDGLRIDRSKLYDRFIELSKHYGALNVGSISLVRVPQFRYSNIINLPERGDLL